MPIVDVSLGRLRGTRRVEPQPSRREKSTARGRPQYVGRILSPDAISEEGQTGIDLSGSSFPCRRVALVAPSFEIRLGPVGQKDGPYGFELGARIVKGFSRTSPMFAGPSPRIEAARPFPRIFVMRTPDPPCDGAGLDVAIIDMPAIRAFGTKPAGRARQGRGRSRSRSDETTKWRA